MDTAALDAVVRVKRLLPATPQEDGTLLEITRERLPDEEAVASYQGGRLSVIEQFEDHLRNR